MTRYLILKIGCSNPDYILKCHSSPSHKYYVMYLVAIGQDMVETRGSPLSYHLGALIGSVAKIYIKQLNVNAACCKRHSTNFNAYQLNIYWSKANFGPNERYGSSFSLYHMYTSMCITLYDATCPSFSHHLMEGRNTRNLRPTDEFPYTYMNIAVTSNRGKKKQCLCHHHISLLTNASTVSPTCTPTLYILHTIIALFDKFHHTLSKLRY